MEYDVVIVGAGPAGLSSAIRLKQINPEISVCVVEKGSEVGAHILSGAVFEPRAMDELFPDWKERGAPLNTPVKKDHFLFYLSKKWSVKLPNFFIPKPTHNHGNYIVSMANVCRWLAEQAEAMEVDIYPGFAASEVVFHEDGSVKGIATGDMGVGLDGEHKSGYAQGMELYAKYTLFAEGCRGHLGKQLIAKFELDKDSDPQHYGIGIKEIWDIPKDKHEEGLVVHGLGWPLQESSSGGGAFLYHAYGARAIIKGGLNSLPKMHFPGGLLIGCDAGTLNSVKIKGNHTAMKSGMLAAECVAAAIAHGESAPADLASYVDAFKASWLYEELHKSRNFSGWMHSFPLMIGLAGVWLEQNIFGGRLPFTLRDKKPDHATMKPAAECAKIDYPKPDNIISFDKASSVFLSSTNHEEDQPCHLQLTDPQLPISFTLGEFDEPAQRYCPAGVYEVIADNQGNRRFQINAQNCVHCKTCDIKEPSQNINWVTPEGAGGPNYPNM
jgi:electron-transferring-flavoprotein dehydrogenase